MLDYGKGMCGSLSVDLMHTVQVSLLCRKEKEVTEEAVSLYEANIFLADFDQQSCLCSL